MSAAVVATAWASGFLGNLWYMLPLVVVISLVYQATRREDMRAIVRSGLRLAGVITVCMVLAAGILMVITSL